MAFNDGHAFSLVMNFSFSLKPGVRPVGSLRKKNDNPFGDIDDDNSQPAESSQKPLDYVKAKLESEQRRAALAAAEARHEEYVEQEEEIGGDKIVDRTDMPLGPAAVAARGSSSLSIERKAASVAAVSRPGLVKLAEPKSAEERNPKHIQRMVETSQVNEKFKNLLKIKIAEKDKAKAEEEFGTKPEEFVTLAYLKQRQESLALEQDL